jgi:Bacteriocin-protection, YdeI or OmpD-Associated
VDVDLELDTEPREVAVPPDLADALDRDLDARRAFDALSYSGKQRLVLLVERAKTAERGGASPGRSRSCGRAATGRGERALPSPSRRS